MIVDIRKETNVQIDTIAFSDEEFLFQDTEGEEEVFLIGDANVKVPIYLESIPDLIKALEKAQEIW